MEQNGIEGVKGLLEYPKLRQTTEVLLCQRDRNELKEIMVNAHELTHSESCPPLVKINICSRCSYFDFCWVKETMNIENETQK